MSLTKTILAFVFIFHSSSFAAIPAQVEKKVDLPSLAEEILSLPEKNRYEVAEKKSDELYPVLIEISQAEKKSMPVRWKALTLAAYLKKEKSITDMEKALKSSEWFMRNAALVAIRSFDTSKARQYAFSLLKDKALVVRSAAVESIDNLKDAKTRDLFWEEMEAGYNFRKTQGLWIREQLLSKLAESPEKKELPLFVKALKDKDSRLHEGAVSALEKITQKKLGKSKDGVPAKRALWIKWAKSPSNMMID